MPRRNAVKEYVSGGYYHLYNRGVEKRDIFIDDQDYRVFLDFLKLYLNPPKPSGRRKNTKQEKEHIDLSKEIDLIAYCLMPNHFHLFVKQNTNDGIAKLMKLINMRYVMYFNRRHNRVGGLFQGVYKAALVNNDRQFTHLSRYIHLNPKGIRRKYDIYPYSSYKYYVSQAPPEWLKPAAAIDMFGSIDEYVKFVADASEKSREELGRIVID